MFPEESCGYPLLPPIINAMHSLRHHMIHKHMITAVIKQHNIISWY
uniref:Uncharacterized protein n=1 Tax=Rhizophora mucronata TaxID=61149 RepID=A0A2P2L959_RHIMU